MTDSVNNFAVFNYGENGWDSGKHVGRPASMAWQCAETYYSNMLSRSTNIYNVAFKKTNVNARSDIGKFNELVTSK